MQPSEGRIFPIQILVHGGAGTIEKSQLKADQELEYHAALKEALTAGHKILAKGGSAPDAVQAAVQKLEDCPLFNAGKGSVFTHDGKHEMDASLMCGRTLHAGAVAGVCGIKNPVALARAIMDHSEHVILCGQGAAEFARLRGLSFESDEYFFSGFRYRQYEEARKADQVLLDHSRHDDKKFGTVGAVALDQNGHLAAATSTGGMTNKKFGRIGDSPLIGAGTYANDLSCAISCTGHGEFFIRGVVAYDVACLVQYKGLSLQEACDLVILEKQVALGGEGGLIGIDTKGNGVFSFNSAGMYRGKMDSSGHISTAIFR